MSEQPTAPPGRAADAYDRNLVVAVLAYQNHFIEQPPLRAALATCAAKSDSSLADVLVEKQQLTRPRRELLEALAREHLKQHANDPQRSLAALSAADRNRRILDELSGSAALQSTGPIHAESLEGTVSLATPPVAVKSQSSTTTRMGGLQPVSQRFRILRPHAEGGLGKVSVARDEELNREVALKEIKPQFAHQVSARNRFLLEAEITGGLEHPGIVPVYSLGADENGHPYYAMRFIQGDSLKDAVQSFFVKHGGQPSAETKLPLAAYQSLEFRRLLGRFVAVCNAISYAHSRGVLHRDIKPGNIMLGSFGETLVVDWGLAKVTGAAETCSTEQGPLAVHSSDTTSGETMMGCAIGTIGYMSPEQAAGRVDRFGPATDIYLLGATLYHLLTGRPPHQGADAAKVLRSIQSEEVANPRQSNKSIPAPLAAICRKALALEPEARYASAQEIAAELERYLADEPVQAHREPLTVRVRRTVRKHPALTAAFTATLLVGVIGFGAGYVLLGNKNMQLANSNQQLAAATIQAQQNQAKAETNEQEAIKKGIESTKLAEFWVGILEGADPISHGVASIIPKTKEETFTVAAMLKQGAERVKNDASLKDLPLAQAAILYTMGDVHRQLGRYDDAQPLLEEALAIRKRALPPDHPDLATSYNALGVYFQERGEYPQADALLQEAIRIRRQLIDEEGQQGLATSLFNLAAMRAHEEGYEDAVELFQEVIEIRTRLHGENHRDVAIAKLGLAYTLFDMRRHQEALKLVAESQSAFEAFEGRQQIPSAAISFAIGTISRRTLGDAAAEAQLRSSLANLLKELDEDSVYVAVVSFELAKVLDDQGKDEEAAEHYETSLRICREQMKLRHPRVRRLIERYTLFLVEKKQLAKADQLWQEFVDAQLATFGEQHRVSLLAQLSYAEYLFDRGRHAEEAALLERIRPFAAADKEPHLILLAKLARTSLNTGDYGNAIELGRFALDIVRSGRTVRDQQALEFAFKYLLAVALQEADELVEAEVHFNDLRKECQALGPRERKVLLVKVLERLIKLAETKRDYAQAADAGLELYQFHGGSVGTSKNALSWLPNPFASAKPAAEKPELTEARNQLAFAYEQLGQWKNSLPLRREGLTKAEQPGGADNSAAAISRGALRNCEQHLAEQEFVAGNLGINKTGKGFPKVTASSSSAADKVERANDGVLNYHPSAPQRWVANPSAAATDWLEIEFEQPTTFSKIELAICDDGAGGRVQTPAACHAEILIGERWTRIEDQLNVPEKLAGNQWNALQFQSVTAKRVRVVFFHSGDDKAPQARSGITEIAIWP